MARGGLQTRATNSCTVRDIMRMASGGLQVPRRNRHCARMARSLLPRPRALRRCWHSLTAATPTFLDRAARRRRLHVQPLGDLLSSVNLTRGGG
jgi:hypothetical protein